MEQLVCKKCKKTFQSDNPKQKLYERCENKKHRKLKKAAIAVGVWFAMIAKKY